MSELRTNRIVPRDGLPSGSAGGIIQVVQATKTDTEQFSLATQTVKQYTNLTATITPTRSDSKILVNVNLSFCFSDDGKGHFGLQRTIGGGTATDIACGDAAGNRKQMSGGYYQDNQAYVNTVNFSFLDSPGNIAWLISNDPFDSSESIKTLYLPFFKDCLLISVMQKPQ